MIGLPDEILELVFLKLELCDLLSAVLVCRRWKSLITESTKIFEKVALVLDDFDDYQLEHEVRDIKYLLESGRKFSVLKIHRKRSLNYTEVLKTFGHNIRSLEINSCHFQSINHFRIILRFLPNLRKLSIHRIFIEKFDDCKYLDNIACIPLLSLPKLRSISASDCNSKIFSLFLNNNCIRVNEINFYHQPEYGGICFDDFIEFLRQQSTIKHLKIDNVSTNNSNFYDNKLSEIFEFKLCELEMIRCLVQEEAAQNQLKGFLKSQSKLAKLKLLSSTLNEDAFLMILKQFSNLESVYLDMSNFEYFHDYQYYNKNVRNLKIVGNFASENQPTFNNMIEHFPNTKTLKLIRNDSDCGAINDKFTFNIFTNLKYLRELHVDGLTARTFDNNFANLSCLDIKHLKVLSIGCIKSDVKYNDWKNLIRNLKNLEKLVIKSAMIRVSGEIIDLFISNLKYLTELELGRGVLNADILNNVINGYHSLKVLRISKFDFENLHLNQFDYRRIFQRNQLLVFKCDTEYFA